MKNIVKIILPLVFLWSCKDDDELKLSIVETFLPSDISTTTATLNGEIEEIWLFTHNRAWLYLVNFC